MYKETQNGQTKQSWQHSQTPQSSLTMPALDISRPVQVTSLHKLSYRSIITRHAVLNVEYGRRYIHHVDVREIFCIVCIF